MSQTQVPSLCAISKFLTHSIHKLMVAWSPYTSGWLVSWTQTLTSWPVSIPSLASGISYCSPVWFFIPLWLIWLFFFFLLRCFWDFVSIAAMQIFPGIWLSIYRSHIMTLAENVVSLSNYKIKCFALCLFQWLWTVSPSRSTVSSTAKLRSQLPGKLGTFSLSNSPLLRASCYCPRSKGQQQETVKQLLSWTEGSVYSSSQWTQAVEGSPVNIRISQYRRFNLRRF